MNLVGEIGNFIIKYQELVQAAVIILVIIAAILMIIKLFKNAKKKQEILTQINDTVSEINTAVNHLQDKKADVIYIDSRMSPAAKDLGVKEIVQTDTDAGSDAAHEVVTEVCSAAAEAEKEAAEPVEEKIEPSLKYFSRDCAVSKTGKRFTIEELNAQIKE